MMDERYWDKMGKDFDGEIFSVAKEDRNGVVAGYITRLRSKQKIASDIGCGVGRFSHLLAPAFKRVNAFDLSGVCLAAAERNCTFDNISFSRCDLANGRILLPKVDFALCVNTIMTPSITKRDRMFGAVRKHLKVGADLILVVPSLESACFTSFRDIQWSLRKGQTPATAVRRADSLVANTSQFRQGILELDGVPTKHYLKEELEVVLNGHHLEVCAIDKVEYAWNTEFEKPPRWMKAPYPWDWCVHARRKR